MNNNMDRTLTELLHMYIENIYKIKITEAIKSNIIKIYNNKYIYLLLSRFNNDDDKWIHTILNYTDVNESDKFDELLKEKANNIEFANIDKNLLFSDTTSIKDTYITYLLISDFIHILKQDDAVDKVELQQFLDRLNTLTAKVNDIMFKYNDLINIKSNSEFIECIKDQSFTGTSNNIFTQLQSTNS